MPRPPRIGTRAAGPAIGPLRARRLIILVCGVALAATACSAPVPDAPKASSRSSTPLAVAGCEAAGVGGVAVADGGLPDLALPCLSPGPTVQVGALTGRPTLINLWATWCAPCREEMPLLAQAFQAQGDTIRFLGVDTRDDAGSATDFLAATGVTYAQAADPEGELLAKLGLPGLPVTLAIDPTGRVIAKHIGQMSPDALAGLVQQLTASATQTTPASPTG